MIKFWSPRDRGVWKKFRSEAVLSVREGFRKGGFLTCKETGGVLCWDYRKSCAGTAKGVCFMEYKFTSANFEEEVLKADRPVLVDFYADWCGPCKMMAPVVAQLADELEGKAKVGKLNIDDCMDIAGKYRVMNIPTFLVIKDGQETARIVGAVSKSELQKKIEQAMG